MKVQLEQQSVRIRIDESELSRLLDDEILANTTVFPGQSWVLSLRLCEGPPAWSDDACSLLLPRDAVQALQARLPSREGLGFRITTPESSIQVRFDVDVRDSVRQRGLPRRAAGQV